jgi:hypothetical protein
MARSTRQARRAGEAGRGSDLETTLVRGGGSCPHVACPREHWRGVAAVAKGRARAVAEAGSARASMRG